jgi:hypothetical protein
MKKISLFLVLFLVINTTANAVLPALIVSLGRMAVTDIGTTLVVGVIAKGFAANDPYVSTDVRITKDQLSKNLAKKGKGFWTALAMGAVALGGDYLIDKINDELLKRVPSAPQVTASHCTVYASSIYPDCVGQMMPAEKISKKDRPDGCYISNKYYSLCEEVSLDYGNFEWSNPSMLGWYRLIAYGPKEPDQFFPATPEDIQRDILPRLSTAPNFNELFAKADLNQLLDGGEMTYRPAAKNASFAELMDAYNRGLLQTADSSAPFFVTPDLFNQVKQAAESEKALNTDEGQLDALNSQMKQPITQAQYEETNKKYSDAVDAITNTLPNNDSDIESIDDSFNKLDGIITDIPNSSLPSPAHIQLPHYTECMTLNLTDGKGRELIFPSSSQCEKINQMKTLIGYFLAGLVAMGLIWQLLTRPHG